MGMGRAPNLTSAHLDNSRPLAYCVYMEFEWDPDKSDACFAERGFDFAYVLRAFMDADRLIHKDTRWDYGEDRYQLLGAIDGRVFFYCVRHPWNDYPDHFGTQSQPTRGV